MTQKGFHFTQTLALIITRIGAEWVLWLLLGLSVMSVAVMVERILFFRRNSADTREFLMNLSELLTKGDRKRAQELAAATRGIEARVALEGLENLSNGPRATEESMGGIVARERARYERNLAFLGTLGNNAPFIGLFGTVLGIIKAFADLSSNVTGGADAVMAGISEALVATAVGLLVALPAVVAYNLFKGKVKALLRNADVAARTVLAHAHAYSQSNANADASADADADANSHMEHD